MAKATATADHLQSPTSSSFQHHGPAEDAGPVAAAEAAANRRSGNLLSCTNCRKRKVKCNKTSPCAACERSGLPCVFPNRARLPRGRTSGSKTTNVELLRRLSKLEELLEKASQDGKPGPAKISLGPASHPRSPDTAVRPEEFPSETPASAGVIPSTAADEAFNRYMSSNFWKNLTHEVEGLRQTLVDVSDEEDDYPTPLDTDSSGSPAIRSARILGCDSQHMDLRALHPTASHMLMFFTLYVANCDPVFKVLHIPTLRNSVREASSDIDKISEDKSMEALLFTLYFAAVTTLTPRKCFDLFQEEKEVLLDRYRNAAEVAFANANLFTNADMTTLQALVIFLFAVRCNDDSPFSWTLTAVAVRIAHSLDLHRESSDLSHTPFIREMRRRLWWQILVLDVNASEDRGSDPMIHEATFNTEKPLNVNDEDLDPDSMLPVQARTGYTAMTFCAIIHEVWMVHRRCNIESPGISLPSPSAEEKISIITNCQQHLNNEYLIHCDLTNPIAWVTSMVGRLVLARFWLAIYHPLQQEHRFNASPAMTRERLLLTTVEILEGAHCLECEPATAQWKWYFNSWCQWHPLAVALAELCSQTQGPLVQRAWTIVDEVFEPWAANIADSKRGMLWRPIQKLMAKAQRNRLKGSLMSGDNTVPPKTEPVQNYYSMPYQQPSLYNSIQDPNPTLQARNDPTDRLQSIMLQHQISQSQPTLPDFAPSFNFGVIGGGGGGDMDPINWTQWDEFMRDFEFENPSDRDFVQQDAKTLGLWF